MDIKTLKQAGIHFSYCRDAMVPEIPYVEDVLYVLQFNEDPRHYSTVLIHPTYVANVHLAAAAVAFKLGITRWHGEAPLRKLIAEAIVGLCPEEARCLFNSAFVSTQKELLGMLAPSYIAMSREETFRRFGCAECRRMQKMLGEEEFRMHSGAPRWDDDGDDPHTVDYS